MTTASTKRRVFEWLSLLAAMAIGPIFLVLASVTQPVFAVAGAEYFIFCATVVSLLVYVAGRFRFLAWQLAIVSLTASVILQDFLAGFQMHGRELLSVAYGFWLLGTLLSSPVPVYFRLKPLPPRRRVIEGSLFAAIAIGLCVMGAFIIR